MDLVNSQIVAKRQLAELSRSDYIVQLEEAILIASKIEKHEAVFLQLREMEPGEKYLLPDSLYSRGAEGLQAELQVLKDRKSDDAFIPGIRELQIARKQLNSFGLNANRLRVAQVDQAAQVPTSPISPDRKSIVAKGFFLGVILAMMLVALLGVAKNQRPKNY